MIWIALGINIIKTCHKEMSEGWLTVKITARNKSYNGICCRLWPPGAESIPFYAALFLRVYSRAFPMAVRRNRWVSGKSLRNDSHPRVMCMKDKCKAVFSRKGKKSSGGEEEIEVQKVLFQWAHCAFEHYLGPALQSALCNPSGVAQILPSVTKWQNHDWSSP